MTKQIGKIPFSKLTFVGAEKRISDLILFGKKCHQVVVANAHSVVLAHNDPEFAEICQEADIVFADGISVIWGSVVLGDRIPERIAGPDFMWSFSNVCAQQGFKMFLLGGATKDQICTLKINLQNAFPGIQITGCYSPPFGEWDEIENNKIIKMINSSGAEILWLGVSTPKQDKWINRFKKKLEVKVAIAVGAAFDFHSGKVERAPKWLQKIGMEWSFRLMQEPNRLWKKYLISNTLFVIIIIIEFFGKKILIRNQQSKTGKFNVI